MARTLLEEKTRIASRINQITSNGALAPGFIQSAEIVRWLNDGLDELVELVSKFTRDFFTQEARADLVANQREYEIYSADMADRYFITDVFLKYGSSDTDYVIAAGTVYRDIVNEDSVGDVTAPIWSYITKDISGVNKLHIYVDPVPTENVTEGLKVLYTEYLPHVAEDADSIDLPVRTMYEWLERYVALQAFDKMGNDSMIGRTEQKLAVLESKMRASFQPKAAQKFRRLVPTADAKRQYAKLRGWI